METSTPGPNRELACADVRREIDGAAALSAGARDHLAGCTACGLAVADAAHAEWGREAADDTAPVPAAIHVPPAIASLVLPLARADRAGFGRLVRGRFGSPGVLTLGLLGLLALAVHFGFPGQESGSPGAEPKLIFAALHDELAPGFAALAAEPESNRLFLRIGPASLGLLGPLPRSFSATDMGFISSSSCFQSARLLYERFAQRPQAARTARALLHLLTPFAAAWHDSDLSALEKALYRDGSADVKGPVAELAWLGLGLYLHIQPEPERRVACARAIELRWQLLRTYGWRAAGLPAACDGCCGLHEEGAWPRLRGDAVQLLGDLAKARLKHAWTASPRAALAALCDASWVLPNFIFLCRFALPSLALCGFAFALWLGLAALRHRAALADGLDLAPRGSVLVRAGGLVGLALPFALLQGGVVWRVIHALTIPWVDGTDEAREVKSLIYRMVHDMGLRAHRDPDFALASGAVAFLIGACAVASQLALHRFVVPERPVGWLAALVPLGGLLALAWPPPTGDNIGLAEPLMFALVLLTAVPFLRRNGNARERWFVAVTAGTCVTLALGNGVAWLLDRRETFPTAHTVLTAWMLALLVWVPAFTGYLTGHLPPGARRLQTLIALAALALGPLFFGCLLVRAHLAAAFEQVRGPSGTDVAIGLPAILGTAILAYLLGLRITPPGAGALRDSAPPASRTGRLLAWLVGSPGLFALLFALACVAAQP